MIHKAKILLLVVLVFGFNFCGEGGLPFSVEYYDTYEVELEVGAASVLGPAYMWKVYIMEGADEVLVETLVIEAGQVDTGNWKVALSFSVLKTKSEQTFTVYWELMLCSGGQEWASEATYQYWMTVVPASSGITVDPTTQKRAGPFIGWDLREVKQLTFKIIKNSEVNMP